MLNIVDVEKPDGCLVQFGGQTPLKLARAAGSGRGADPGHLARTASTWPRTGGALARCWKSWASPSRRTARPSPSRRRARWRERIGYPVLVRPSYVLGGRAMAIVYDERELEGYIREAVEVTPDAPVLIDRFLEDAFEMDVDAIGDGEDAVIGGIMEQIELAGVHSGDSACVLPTYMVAPEHIETMRRYTRQLARALKVCGLMNVQYAMQGRRGLRPGGQPPRLAHDPLCQQGDRRAPRQGRGPGHGRQDAARAGPGRGPAGGAATGSKSRSSRCQVPGRGHPARPGDEEHGRGDGRLDDFGWAFAKAQMGVGGDLPPRGTVLLSVNDNDKPTVLPHASALHEMGLQHAGHPGTAEYLNAHGVPAEMVYKVHEGRPNVVDLIKDGKIRIVFNTPLGARVLLRRRRDPQERRPPQRARGHDADRHRRHRAGDPRAARAGDRHPLACRRSTPGGASTQADAAEP